MKNLIRKLLRFVRLLFRKENVKRRPPKFFIILNNSNRTLETSSEAEAKFFATLRCYTILDKGGRVVSPEGLAWLT